MLDKPQRPWIASDAAELYHLDRWGRGFFSIDSDGYLTVKADKDAADNLRISDVVNHFSELGKSAPMIVRFPGIVHQRIEQINRAFQGAINSYGFQGKYRLFYPVKVNQHLEVMSAALEAGGKFGGGLESGSKAELLAVIAMSDNQTPLLCNGFKDKSVAEMALRASKLGRDITIVIEKPNELELILNLAQDERAAETWNSCQTFLQGRWSLERFWRCQVEIRTFHSRIDCRHRSSRQGRNARHRDDAAFSSG